MRIEQRKQMQQARLKEARTEFVEARGKVLRLIAAAELDLAYEKIDFLSVDNEWALSVVMIKWVMMVSGERIDCDIAIDSSRLDVID